MFTGIIKEIGRVKAIRRNQEGFLLQISCPKMYKELSIDDSLAVNGVCQTITEKIGNDTVEMQAVHGTLEKTNFDQLKVNSPVNLECAANLQTALGGHLVSGHVSVVAKVCDIQNRGHNYLLTISLEKENLKYCIAEGSICLNGVSLTIYHLDDARGRVQVSVIPHTWTVTTFKDLKVGDVVNVEFDQVAKYIERMLKFMK